MPPIPALVVAIAVGLAGCTSEQSDRALCDAYLQTIPEGSNGGWHANTSPSSDVTNAAVARLHDQFAAIGFPARVDGIWYEDNAHRVGLCTLDGSPKCAMGFFVYPPDGLNGEPTTTRISMSCGPM
jgi:hypothetical protein